MINEHRKYRRYPLTATVRIDPVISTALYTMTINISRDGIGVYSNSLVHNGSDVKLDIMFKDIRGKDMMETLKGKVVHSYKWHWVYVAGIKFNQLLSQDNTPYLLEYIEYCENRDNYLCIIPDIT
ncbi:MAG: PilZ domain-containing protein [Nitrospirae bacterium]|nr:PilZ domain-containing protein [Nitrospirota bacterium]